MKTNAKTIILTLFLGGLTAILSCSEDPEVVLSGEKDILSFSVPGQKGPAIINASSLTVVAEVDCGTNLTGLAPTFTLSQGAISSPATGTAADYSNQVTITVTAEDGTSAGWKVTISEACANATDILAFTLPEQTGDAVINADTHTIGIEVENRTILTSLTPTFTLSEGANSDPASGTAGDYSAAVTITVTAEDGATTQEWEVNVSEAPSAETGILLFLIEEQTSLADIDHANHTVAIEMVNGTDLTNLTPKFLLFIGASSVPVSETAGNYSSAAIITVTAEDGTTMQDWTVNVSEAAAGVSDKTDILSFTIPEETSDAFLDGTAYKVIVEVATGTDLTSLTPTWTLSPGATSVPVSGTPGDYSSNVTITVTAEDGTTTQNWTIEVYLVDDFDASIFCEENLCTVDGELQQQCQDFLIECLEYSHGLAENRQCVLAALAICSEVGI